MDIIIEDDTEDLFRPMNVVDNSRIVTSDLDSNGRPIVRFENTSGITYHTRPDDSVVSNYTTTGINYIMSVDPIDSNVFTDLVPPAPVISREESERMRQTLDDMLHSEDSEVAQVEALNPFADFEEQPINLSTNGLRQIQVYEVSNYGLELEENEYNTQQKMLDNEWLYSKVQEGWLALETYTQIQIIKDCCESTYPGNWDLQLRLSKFDMRGHFDNPNYNRASRDIQPYGCYFGVEGDTIQWYWDNYDWSRIEDADSPTVTRPIPIIKFISQIDIIIKFPEVTVSNDRGMSMVLTNLYYKFKLVGRGNQYADKICFRGGLDNMLELVSNNCGDSTIFKPYDEVNGIEYSIKPLKFNGRGLEGMRTSPTSREVAAQYAFSHMRARDSIYSYMTFNGCCLGSGEISQTISLLGSDLGIDMYTFQMLLFQLEAYTVWESLEGGPYVRISNVLGTDVGTERCDAYDYSERYYTELMIKRRSTNTPKRLNWNISPDGVVTIQDDDLLQDFCRIFDTVSEYDYLNTLYNRIPVKKLLYFRDAQGLYHKVSASQQYSMPASERFRSLGGEDTAASYPLLFRGENQYFEVLEDTQVSEENINRQVFYINDNVVKYIKDKLEYAANKQKIETDIASRAYAVAHQPRNF